MMRSCHSFRNPFCLPGQRCRNISPTNVIKIRSAVCWRGLIAVALRESLENCRRTIVFNGLGIRLSSLGGPNRAIVEAHPIAQLESRVLRARATHVQLYWLPPVKYGVLNIINRAD